jgi:hypothetical protein
VLEIVLAFGAVVVCQFMQALDDFLSQFGVVSLAHGGLLGYGQVFVAKVLVDWGGGRLGWWVVILIAIAAMAVSAYKIHSTGTRWVFAFNFGVLCGIVYGGVSLV